IALADEPVVAPQVAVTRDAASWPFSVDSPWNTSLGATALYATITSPGFSLVGPAHVNSSEWSHPIYTAQASDPLVSIYEQGVLFGLIRVPASAMPDFQADHSLHVIDEAHRTVVEMWLAERLPNGDIACAVAVRNDLSDAGVYDVWHGARAYGGSAIAGLIRREELLAFEIPHALAIAVSPETLNRNAPGGTSWVWPASWSDGGDGSDYGTTGNLHMGSLLAIPPDVMIDALPLSPVGRAIGHALQDYGAYIVDSSDSNLSYYAEPSAAELVPGSFDTVLARLNRFLRVVNNNSPTSVGGGGQRRRDPAPPFGDPFLDIYSISGVVRSQTPIAEVVINLYDETGQWLAVTTSDATGHYRFDGISTGGYELTFEAVSQMPLLKPLIVDGDETLDVATWGAVRRNWWQFTFTLT
ncbi:MAG: carboxypeptidase-like regulatory domain-containing protein, partial [Pirellulales bacterium]